MLKISNVHKTFNPNTINEKKALNGVGLVLNEGDFVTVIEMCIRDRYNTKSISI